MTSAQKKLFIALTILVAITRWWAMSKSIWDWDEALFSSGVRSFDVVAHHPHPPGFPLFILFGKALNVLLNDEFRSLQAVSFVGAVVLFPATFLLAREIGFTFAVSIGGALLTVFAPNVWFFGGTAFSDVPSLTLIVAACAVLLYSRHAGPRFFVAGSFLLGVAAGFRSQNLAIGFLPFVLATWTYLRARRWGVVLAGGCITAAIVVASYVGAGLASYSWTEYRTVLQQHRIYITTTDSFRNPNRPSLTKVFDDFFIRQFQFFRASAVIFVLAMISAVDGILRRRRAPPLILIGMFGPFALMAWLVLDFISASRFSIGYIPLFAILAADGAASLVALVAIPARARELIAGAIAGFIALGLILWAAPGITEAHRDESPPAQAVNWIRANLSPRTARLFVAGAMMPVAEYELPDYRITRVVDERAVPLKPAEMQDAYVFAEGATMEPSGINFIRSRHSRLWRIARPRYFEVSIIPMAKRAQFLDGWYEAENEGAETWRWMGRRSMTRLPPQPPPAELRLTLGAPLDVIPVPTVRVMLNGKLIDQFRAERWMTHRTIVVRDSRTDGSNELVIETDQWINPKQRGITDDPRDLGLRLHDMTWGPLPSSRRREGGRALARRVRGQERSATRSVWSS